MKHVQHIQIAFSSVCLVSLFFLNSCSIFGPVGHAISQGYENTVSYFNGYYNAKWLFSEAEDEIHSDALLKRGQESSSAAVNQIPGSAKDKLTKVIDKCSNILAFHPTSTLVDDALILIGKSFYYQAENLKAERKFAELLAQFPNSPLVLETQIWYARTEEKLGKVDEGIRICESTVSTAKRSGDDEVEVQAHLLLGRFYLMSLQTEKTIEEYEIAAKLSTDKEIKTDIQMRLGDIYFSGGQYEEAAKDYLKVGEYTSDVYSNYYSKLRAAISFRKIKEYKKGLALLGTMIEDFRNKIYLPELLYERAFNYDESGKRSDAIDEYTYVDTIYTPKEYSIRSAYQLAKIYENEISDYQLALKYYAKVNSSSGIKSLDSGRVKYAAFIRYFEARKKLGKADSLLFVLSEANRKAELDSLSELTSDTVNREDALLDSLSMSLMSDSLAFITDSLPPKGENIISRFPSVSADSLRILQFLSDSVQHEIWTMITKYSQSRADSLVKLKSLKNSIQHRIAQISSQQKLQKTDSLKSRSDLAQRVHTQVSIHRSSIDSLKTMKSLSDLKQNGNPKTPSRQSHNRIDSLKMHELLADSLQNKKMQPNSLHLSSNIDSLKLKTDSVQNKDRSIASYDSLSILDSLKSQSDSTNKGNLKITPKPVGISADSLNILKSIAAQELGDLFYSEIIVPDSAFYWYDHALTWNYYSSRSPRILYILAELSRENPHRDYSTSDEYYIRLAHDFPESIYAEEARRFLGKTVAEKKIDTAAVYYEQAEKQVDAKQYKKAIKTFSAIAQLYPQSPLAARSDYAIGWILENHLELPESAFVQYKHVAKNYEGTKYALAAANQIVGALKAEKERLDSLKKIAAQLDSAKAKAAKLDSAKANAAHFDSSKIIPANVDSSKLKAVMKDTSSVKDNMIDSSRIRKAAPDTLKNKSTLLDIIKSTEEKRDTSIKDTSKNRPGSVNQEPRVPMPARKDSAEIRKRMLD